MATSKAVMASLTHLRPLTCAASASSYSARLVPHPPDLIKWVTREGGFVHRAVKIAPHDSNGLGLVAKEQIPKGSDLIVLPDHVPLRFRSLESNHQDALDSVLVELARLVPGMYPFTCFKFECLMNFVHIAVKFRFSNHYWMDVDLVRILDYF